MYNRINSHNWKHFGKDHRSFGQILI